MKKLSDQIKDLENTRAAKAGRMADITQKSIDEGRSMDEAEAEEFDTIDGEIKLLDADFKRHACPRCGRRFRGAASPCTPSRR